LAYAGMYPSQYLQVVKPPLEEQVAACASVTPPLSAHDARATATATASFFTANESRSASDACQLAVSDTAKRAI
jgi:hypothetical protein